MEVTQRTRRERSDGSANLKSWPGVLLKIYIVHTESANFSSELLLCTLPPRPAHSEPSVLVHITAVLAFPAFMRPLCQCDSPFLKLRHSLPHGGRNG